MNIPPKETSKCVEEHFSNQKILTKMNGSLIPDYALQHSSNQKLVNYKASEKETQLSSKFRSRIESTTSSQNSLTEEMKIEHQKVNSFLHQIFSEVFEAESGLKVDGLLWMTEFLLQEGVTSSNYGVYLQLLSLNNHWVADAIFKNLDPYYFFDSIAVNAYLVNTVFVALRTHQRNQIYEKTLIAYFGILKRVYSHPNTAYSIYPNLCIEEINSIAKFLNYQQIEEHPTNQKILEILDLCSKIDQYVSTVTITSLMRHIRNIIISFYTPSKGALDVLPYELLEDSTLPIQETPPRE